tara:strand:+ start:242 stop:706 length:465 start_codon:yes stop_codon:yes gene_type:complete
MNVTDYRYKYCKKQGKDFEQDFKNRIIKAKLNYKKSTKEDDWYKHIDCYVNGYGVDVKGNRRLETIWLEYTNVNGNKGWLKGDAMYIAMHITELDIFSIYKRIDLLNFIKKNTNGETINKNEYFKFYTRKKWNKKDKIVKVKYNDIKHLEIKKI